MPVVVLTQHVLAFYLCFTLVATALAKLRSFGQVTAITTANLNLPKRAGSSVVVAVIAGEILLAGMIASNRWPTVTALALATMFLTFAIYRAVLLAGNRSTCACAGSRKPVSRGAMIGNVVSNVLLASLTAAWGASAIATDPQLQVGAYVGIAISLAGLVVGVGRHRQSNLRGTHLV